MEADVAGAAATQRSVEAERPIVEAPRPEIGVPAAVELETAVAFPEAAPGSEVAPASAEFERFMGSGLAALANGEAETARGSFALALEIRPSSEAAAEGLARAEEALRLAAIAGYRQAAREHEIAEDWRSAVKTYEAALAVDPALGFAQEGVGHARTRALLDGRLEYHLANPGRLSADEVLAEATALLAEAQGMVKAGPRLASQRTRLARALALAATPVEVVLESDGQTDIAVFRVGELGRFNRRALELRPGTYVVVGRRSGYRDVRRKLVVTAAGTRKPLRIRCEEEI